MHVTKAHTSTDPLQARAQDTFGFRFGCILLAACANGAAWCAIALVVCLIVGFPTTTIPVAAGLAAGGATFLGLFAFGQH